MADEQIIEEEKRPKWVNPNKKQFEPPKPKWVNPNTISSRERMDRRLEQYGLLNYQTQGLSQEEIARRYAAANITVNGKSQWFKDNYGFDAPTTITNRSEMNDYRRQAAQTGTAPNIMPTLDIKLTPSGGNADRPTNFAADPASGLLMRVKQGTQAVSDSPFAGDVFATNDQAKAGEANWTDISADERSKILNDPTFYTTNQITQYPTWMQQQILADPSFSWDNLPKDQQWQKYYYQLSSSPAGMGMVQGATMGAGGGWLGAGGGAIAGGIFGYGAAKSGYDQTREFWQQDTKLAGAFGLMNWLAEQTEKTAGLVAQSVAILTGNDPNFDPNKRNLDVNFNKDFNLMPGKNFNPELLSGSSWDAGASFFEVMGPALHAALTKNADGKFTAADVADRVPVVQLARMVEVFINPEKYKGEEVYLGAATPVKLDETWVERLKYARDEIKAGRDYREVMTEMQTGVIGQMSDMALQAAVDPLNVLPETTTKAFGKVAELAGNPVAAEALKSSGGLKEAASKYRNMVQSKQAMIIDPNFRVDEMGRLSRMIAGVNSEGAIRKGGLIPTDAGLLDPVKERPKNQGFVKNVGGWLEDFFTQDPYSRAREGAGMFYDNMGALFTMFETPEEASRFLRSLANNEDITWAEYAQQFAGSPEFYTVLPALRDFNTSVLEGISKTWEMSAPNRDLLGRVADVFGDNPGKVLEDLVKRGTAEQDFQRLVKKLNEVQTPTAKALLEDINAGRLTAETLKQMVDVFTGEGALPWHEGQWKALMLDKLGTHFDEWVTQRMMLDQTPEAKSAFFRTAALMKQAQSILLLGGSPGYALTNGMSNMVSRAMGGVFGYMMPSQIDDFINRMGFTPARFEEGVGIGGMVEQAAGSSGLKTSAMDKAMKGSGPLTVMKDALGKISKGMPFSKLSSWFEKVESKQAFSIAMRDMWSNSWRRGVGFREMSPELVRVMTDMGVDPKRMYAAIEAGMNQGEIEKALMGRQAEVQARSLIHDAAEKTGMSASEAAQMLERVGVLDTLDKFLKGQTTKDGVAMAFKRAERVAQDWMDMKMGEDLKAKAEYAKQRVGIEGAAAALDVAQRAHGEFTDAWMDHYHRFGEVMNDLQLLDDPMMKDKAIDEAYNVSDREFRRVFANSAANYAGIFEAWGMSGEPRALRVLESIGAVDAAMGNAYKQMRENIREWRQAWAGDLQNPKRWDEWNTVQAKNDRVFKDGFKAKHDAEVKMGSALGEVYESLYGAAAGEAARLWWEDMVKFGDEITKQENDFRGQIKQARASGVPSDLIAAEKQKYYSEKKPVMIAELEKINAEGIARLERVIKNGGDGGQTTLSPAGDIPPSPADLGGTVAPERPAASKEPSPQPSPVGRGGSEEVNALRAASEQRKVAEAKAKEDQVAGVWDIAEEYWGKGGNYSREILQDRFALITALKDPEYGGIPDLFDLSDPRLTLEKVRDVLEARKVAKETNAAAAANEAFQVTAGTKKRRFDSTQITENTSLLRAIALHGGLSFEMRLELTGEKNPKGMPGTFTRKGVNIDEMALLLVDDGYPIDISNPDDNGGVNQLRDLIERARNGEKIYPMYHDYNAEIAAAEQAWIDSFSMDNVQEIPFDSALWQTEFDQAVQAADLDKVYEMIGNVPSELLTADSGQGGTWQDYLSRTADDVAVRATEQATMERVAERAAESRAVVAEAESHAAAVTKRTVALESLKAAFPAEAAKIEAWGDVLDETANWYARMTGESSDNFYNRYFGGAERGGAVDVDALMQQAFHGSPYKFDQFTLDHIGSGEGAQAYGWGLYFADDKAVAEHYRQTLSNEKVSYKGLLSNQLSSLPDYPNYAASEVLSGMLRYPKDSIETIIKNVAYQNADIRDAILALDPKDFKRESGQTYRVEIPDDGYLLWDRPLSEQPQAVKDFMKEKTGGMIPDDARVTGREIYEGLYQRWDGTKIGDPKSASLELKEAGINGIQYLDGSSRGKGEGNYNYVIFDDAAIQIKETFYQAEQQGGLWGAGEDTPLFSGAAQKAKMETYKPTEAGKQNAMFDMRPQFGTGEASLAPMVDGSEVPGTVTKGMVTFEGVRGTITAFEAADFSTVVHETSHIYRRVLADVAERTKNPYILRDLQTVEAWAGVLDGNWTREAEEKFARGFERYITEGHAPTPKLRAAFENFRSWMLDIYKSITGSSIDVKITDDVRRVFDRMLGAENLRIDIDNMLMQMKYDPKRWTLDGAGNIVERPTFEINVDKAGAARQADAALATMEGLQERAAALRERINAGSVPKGPDAEVLAAQVVKVRDEYSGRGGYGGTRWSDTKPVSNSQLQGLKDWTLQEMKNAKGGSQNGGDVGQLFQQSEVPFGKYAEDSGFVASGDGLDALWREKVNPLLKAMEAGAMEQVDGLMVDGGRDMSPEGQAMLRKYMQQVKGDMATTKLATVRYAEKQRDFALLNYNKRYGFDRYADFVMPYQFYTSRSMAKLIPLMMDKPAILANYARLRNQANRYERDIPERMRGKIQIPAPWLPDWAGDSLWIDPMRNLFFPENLVRNFERKQQEKTYQVIEAERVLQEWQAAGTYSDAQIIEAAKSQNGKIWERAWEEAQMRRESETASPADFFTSFFGPAWYLSTPMNLAGIKLPGISKGDPNQVNTIPLGNTARAFDTVTQGTWAEPFGDLIGLIGKGENKLREKFNLPTQGEYAEYYTKRQVANMVAEGKYTAEQAQIAMIEKSGPIWDEAKQRVDMEAALRVPLAGTTYALLHGGAEAGAQAFLPSMFGASLLPAGELEYRGLKQEWNDAWKLADAGDTTAVQRFFDNYPEYEASLAKNKDDGELLKSFLIGEIWDGYMALGDTNKKQARAELGDEFSAAFLNSETRSYETLTAEQLAQWAQLLGQYVPKPSGQAALTPAPLPAGEGSAMRMYPEEVTQITDQFFVQRREQFPNYYEEQAAYYDLPKNERKGYLATHPNLKAYWQWKDKWYSAYPEYKEIFNGNAFDRVDTSAWMPGLEAAVMDAAMSGGSLPTGARAALYNEWLMSGQPMDDFDTWVKSAVMPGMLYGGGR